MAAIDPPSRRSGGAGDTLSMKRLRDAPTRSGRPNDFSSASREMAMMLCSGVLPKPMPGSSTMRSRAMPARSAISSEREKNAVMSAMMSIAGSAASRLCMMITGTAVLRHHAGHVGIALQAPDVIDDGRARRPAPSRRPSAFMVSIETGTPSATTAAGPVEPPHLLLDRDRHRIAIGTGRFAPMSRMSAPSSPCARACSIARRDRGSGRRRRRNPA